MYIAEIVPVNFLHLTENHTFHMCLAHLVLKNDEYASFYRRMSHEGKYVIMDNGACEGESLSDEELFEAYDRVNPSEVILPDILKDAEGTINRSCVFYNNNQGKLSSKGYNIMIVPQGTDLRSWISCAEKMNREIPHNCIGIPKWLGSIRPANRVAAALYAQDLEDQIHLLGCSEPPMVIQMCGILCEKVRSCDSAFAYLCCKARYDHIHGLTQRPDEKIDFLKDNYDHYLDRLMYEFEMSTGGKA